MTDAEKIDLLITALQPFADKTLWEDNGGEPSEEPLDMWIQPAWIRAARAAIEKAKAPAPAEEPTEPRERGTVVRSFTQDELFRALSSAGLCDGAAYGAWPDHKRARVYNENRLGGMGHHLYPPGHLSRDKYDLVKINVE